jgi:anti-sigma regulatory factor (Ser/Thr protein kinase)
VQLRLRVGLHEVEVAVRDSGPGFVGDDEPHPPVGDPTRLDFERGLGIPLIQFLADEVDYDSGPDGTEATVIVRDGDGGRSAS